MIRPLNFVQRAIAIVSFASFALVQIPADASTEIQKELVDVAKSIAGVLSQRNENRIAVGQFTGPSRMPSSSGPAIAKALSDELGKLGIMVSRRAPLEVKGDYLAVVNERNRGPAALLKGRMLDATGTVVYEFEKGFSNDATVAALFGLTVEIPPNESPRETRKRLRESIDEPKATISSGAPPSDLPPAEALPVEKPAVANTRLSAGSGSPYQIEVLVKTPKGYEPRPLTDDEGLAFAPIQKEETYAIRIYNNSPYDAAVTVSVDGLNLFSFSENPAYKQLGIVILGAKSSGTIYGWHRTNETSDSFLVTEYSKSAAAELKQTADLGTITCSFCAAWPQGTEPPPDELVKRGDTATGRGASVAAKYQEVARQIGRMRAACSIRYTKPATP